MFGARRGAAVTPVEMELFGVVFTWKSTSLHFHFLIIQVDHHFEDNGHIEPNLHCKAVKEALSLSLYIDCLMLLRSSITLQLQMYALILGAEVG